MELVVVSNLMTGIWTDVARIGEINVQKNLVEKLYEKTALKTYMRVGDIKPINKT
jgi:hypothetical protein